MEMRLKTEEEEFSGTTFRAKIVFAPIFAERKRSGRRRSFWKTLMSKVKEEVSGKAGRKSLHGREVEAWTGVTCLDRSNEIVEALAESRDG